MIAPALCHLQYLMVDGDSDNAPMREHSAYIPLQSDTVYPEQTHFNLDVTLLEGRLTVEIFPLEEITVTGMRIMMTGDFTRYEKTLFNGYQSWTDTREVALDAVTRGLTYTPKSLVDRFVLDGSGDYRFKRYVSKPGVHHGWTYAYFVGEPGVWLVASLDESNGFTLLEWSAGDGLNIRKETPTVPLHPGVRFELADLAIIDKPALGQVEHAIDRAFEDWFELKAAALPGCSFPRTDEMLTGYSSWYRHYGDITEEKIRGDLVAAQRMFDTLRTDGFRRVFQIDDGYARVGDWADYDTAKFPEGLAPLAHDIQEAGFTPGIWVAPFVCEKESRLMAEHPDWVMRDGDGEYVRAGSHWSGSYALDTLNPEVRDYIFSTLRMMAQDWGFELFKLDFLYAACMIPHGEMNRGELMADAMQLVRDALGPDVLIDGCGVPLASAFGIVDFCRIGCDVGLDWDGALYMRLTERERVSTRNSLFNTVYRAPLDGKAFGNDPDVLLLRKDVSYTDEQRNMVLYGDACHASMLLTSDDFDTWTDADRAMFQGALDLMRATHASDKNVAHAAHRK